MSDTFDVKPGQPGVTQVPVSLQPYRGDMRVIQKGGKRLLSPTDPRRAEGIHPRAINVALLHTAMGDSLASLPAVQYIADLNPRPHVKIWAGDYIYEFIRHVFQRGTRQGNVTVDALSRMGKGHEQGQIVTVNSARGNFTPIKSHLMEFAWRAICDREPVEGYRNYPLTPAVKVDKSLGLPEEYACVTVNYTTGCRAMRQDLFEDICEHLKSKGVTPVVLGASKQAAGMNLHHQIFTDHIIPDGVLDLRDKTSVTMAHAVIAGSLMVIGVDGGLQHLAAYTDVPVIAGFTNTDPSTREPWRHDVKGWNWQSITPPPSLGCRGCQSRWDLTYEHDFMGCYYGDTACVDLLPTAGFTRAIDNLLGEKK